MAASDSMPYEEERQGKPRIVRMWWWWCICKDVAQRRCEVVEDACRAGAVVDGQVGMSVRAGHGMAKRWMQEGPGKMNECTVASQCLLSGDEELVNEVESQNNRWRRKKGKEARHARGGGVV